MLICSGIVSQLSVLPYQSSSSSGFVYKLRLLDNGKVHYLSGFAETEDASFLCASGFLPIEVGGRYEFIVNVEVFNKTDKHTGESVPAYSLRLIH